MNYPKFITTSSTIGVPAPSAGSSNELYANKYRNSERRLKKLGYNLVLSKNLYSDIRGRSATAKERAEEINEMFKSENIDLILCATGGEFLVEMLPYVNFELLAQNPKFVCGFSDPTGLLYTITTTYDIASIYGKNYGSYGKEEIFDSEKDFLKLITNEKLSFESYELYEEEGIPKVTGLEPPNLTEKVYWNVLNREEVNVKGRIIGGCLDIIAELAGTKYDGINSFNEKYKEDGVIWYFDNCELSHEEVIRTLWKLNELEYFKYTKAVIFGRFGVNLSNCGYDVKSCLMDSILNEKTIPIVYDADFSHKDPCMPVINGAITEVKVKSGKAFVSYELL